jgi:hypothetical protein
MRTLVTILAAVCPLLPAAAQDVARKKDFSAMSVLPDGSQLHDVILPRYDENRVLTAVLKAGVITLVNGREMTGGDVAVRFFNPDRSERGQIDLVSATFDRERNFLRSDRPVKLRSERLDARGAGLFYDIGSGEGFLMGPAVTTIFPKPRETAMKTHTSPIRAAAVLGMALVSQPLAAQETPAATAAANKESRANLRATLEASAAANRAATAFLDKADLLAANDAAAPDATPEPAPLEVEPDPNRTVIDSDGGFYFDAAKGVFVFLKNVRVHDPRFELTGANDLKIFTEKQPSKADAKDGGKPKGMMGGGGIDLGDVEKMVATGAVKFRQKQPKPGEQPLVASGAIFTYNVKAGDIVISGGYPWFTRGKDYLRAKEPNLTLRIDKDFNASTEGDWQLGLTVPEKKK